MSLSGFSSRSSKFLSNREYSIKDAMNALLFDMQSQVRFNQNAARAVQQDNNAITNIVNNITNIESMVIPPIEYTISSIPYGSLQYNTIISDERILPSSKVHVYYSSSLDTDENSMEMDSIGFQVVSMSAGNFLLRLFSSKFERFGGAIKINYTIG